MHNFYIPIQPPRLTSHHSMRGRTSWYIKVDIYTCHVAHHMVWEWQNMCNCTTPHTKHIAWHIKTLHLKPNIQSHDHHTWREIAIRSILNSNMVALNMRVRQKHNFSWKLHKVMYPSWFPHIQHAFHHVSPRIDILHEEKTTKHRQSVPNGKPTPKFASMASILIPNAFQA